MKDDPHPTKAMREEIMSRFFTAALFLTAVAAKAQAQETKSPELDKQTPSTETVAETPTIDDKSGVTLNLGAGEIISLTATESGTELYSDATPNVEATISNKRGDFAKFSAMESLTLNNKEYNALTIKFMVELGKQLGDGSTIIFKAGRESTEAGGVYDVAMHHYADAQNIATFGNLADVLAIRYKQEGIGYGEIGLIGSPGDGDYVIPNTRNGSLWLKGGLTAFDNCTADIAARLGNGHKDLLASIGIKSNAGLKARIMGKYDFVERSGALCADAIQDLHRGWKLMAGTSFKQGQEIRLHCGVDKDNVQFSVECVKEKEQKAKVNLTVATKLNWARSKLYKK